MSAFILSVLGIKCDIAPHTPPSVTPFVTPCIFLYEITVLIGEIVVYARVLEFQEIMEVVLCTNLDRKSLENGEQSYLNNVGKDSLWAYTAHFTVCASKMLVIDVEILLSCKLAASCLCALLGTICLLLCAQHEIFTALQVFDFKSLHWENKRFDSFIWSWCILSKHCSVATPLLL